MRKLALLLFVICNTLAVYGQKGTTGENRTKEELIASLEKSINDIRVDLQEKKLQCNYTLVEKYLDFCEKNNRTISISKEPMLTQLAFVTKPKEIEPQRETYEKTKDELQKMLKSYPEYVLLDSMYKRATDENIRKNINLARSNFYTKLADENKEYRPLRDKEQLALRQHYIAAVRYLLNDCKNRREVMPTNIIDYSLRKTILDSDPELNQLYIEVGLLENLQREQLRKYQRIKYNVEDDKITEGIH